MQLLTLEFLQLINNVYLKLLLFFLSNEYYFRAFFLLFFAAKFILHTTC
jgi:hypothetical protein